MDTLYQSRLNRALDEDLENITKEWKQGLLTRKQLAKELKALAKIINRVNKLG